MIKKIIPFEIKKTFGVDVLLKLTKTNNHGLKILENDGQYTFNVTKNKLSRTVNSTLKNYNITLVA
jgi:hypothetical protein